MSEICVTDGQDVSPGQLLVVMNDEKLASDLSLLDLEIRRSKIRGRQHEHHGRIAAFQAEAAQRKALETRLTEKRAQLQQLEIRAPVAGAVIARNLATLLGDYLETGDEVLTIGGRSQKQLRVSISQDDLEPFLLRFGQPIRFDLSGHEQGNGRLDRVDPWASKVPVHPALSAMNGGPLPVRNPMEHSGGSREQAPELVEPHFQGLVLLNEELSRSVYAGQVGTVCFRPWHESIGEYIGNAISRWTERRLSCPR